MALIIITRRGRRRRPRGPADLQPDDRRRNAVDNSWAQIEAALQRRHDLIPNLVEAVKGYAKHEQKTFENVTKARTTATGAKAPPSQAAAEDTLTAAIGRLMVVAEQYPELRATENFQQLQALAVRDRGPDPDHPPRLQRHGPDLQHLHPESSRRR